MSIYLSATAIKDFIACPKRIYYRTNFPELAETNPDMQVGTIVHEVVEKNWDNKEKALSSCLVKVTEEGLASEYVDKASKALWNFFDSPVYEMLGKGDLIEHKFKITLDDNSYLVGKIDRITSNGTVIDWKTSASTPKTIDKDPQFLAYYWAYRSLFKKNPGSVLYMSLVENKVVRLHVNPEIYFQLFHEIIPSILVRMRKNDLPRTGLFTGSCFKCNFKKVCATDMENEVGK
jgi:CRISPR/Cas system-associated exonuclease Cas4 (RecB family)